MTVPNAIIPTLKEIEKTLSAGNRLWLVGGVQFMPRHTRPLPAASAALARWVG